MKNKLRGGDLQSQSPSITYFIKTSINNYLSNMGAVSW